MKRFFSLLITGLILWGGHTVFAMPGAYQDVEVTEEKVVEAAKFAVRAKTEQIEKQNSAPIQLALVEILSAQQQVVSGMNYKLILKVSFNNQEKEVNAIIWWQAWRTPDPYRLTSWEWM